MSDHHVDVGRAPGVAAHESEQLSRGTGGVDGVLGGLQAVERELAVLIGAELAAEVMTSLVLGVENVVFAVGAGLPHIEDGVGNGLASLSVRDDTVEESELSIRWHVLDDAGTKLAEWGIGGPERSEDGRGGRVNTVRGLNLVVDLIDETKQELLAMFSCRKTTVLIGVYYSRFDTKDIAHSPCLVSVLLPGLANGVDVVDTDNPLVLSELDLTAEVVQVSDQGGEDLSVSGFRFGAHEINDMLCEVGVIFALGAVGTVGTVGGTISAVDSHDDSIAVFLVNRK